MGVRKVGGVAALAVMVVAVGCSSGSSGSATPSTAASVGSPPSSVPSSGVATATVPPVLPDGTGPAGTGPLPGVSSPVSTVPGGGTPPPYPGSVTVLLFQPVALDGFFSGDVACSNAAGQYQATATDVVLGEATLSLSVSVSDVSGPGTAMASVSVSVVSGGVSSEMTREMEVTLTGGGGQMHIGGGDAPEVQGAVAWVCSGAAPPA